MDSGSPSIEQACRQAEHLMASNAASNEIFLCLVAAAEQVSGAGAVSSVLVLDESGLLRNGASPNLPLDYLRAIDGLKPDAELGTCAAAAATGGMVVTPSFLADDKWAELRHLPLAIGFAGAWSMPIKSSRDGRVLGTFGTYYRDVRRPSPQEVNAMTALAAAAARALDRNRAS
jgi:GAF domain-containing protein